MKFTLTVITTALAPVFFAFAHFDDSLEDYLVEHASAGDETQVEHVLQHGAHIDGRDQYGETALLAASQNGHSEVVDFLLQAGASTEIPDDEGNTPLMLAAINGWEDVVDALLTEGANASARNFHGAKVLPYALCESRGDGQNFTTEYIVHLLLSAGADIKGRAPLGGHSPLICALTREKYAAANALIEHGGIDVNARISPDDRYVWAAHTALMIAAYKGQSAIVAALLDAGADFDIQARSSTTRKMRDGYTALTMAVKRGHIDVARLLVRAGAGLDYQTDLWHNTALGIAASKGDPDMVLLLVDAGANLHLTTNYNAKAVHLVRRRLVRESLVKRERDRSIETACILEAAMGDTLHRPSSLDRFFNWISGIERAKYSCDDISSANTLS